MGLDGIHPGGVWELAGMFPEPLNHLPAVLANWGGPSRGELVKWPSLEVFKSSVDVAQNVVEKCFSGEPGSYGWTQWSERPFPTEPNPFYSARNQHKVSGAGKLSEDGFTWFSPHISEQPVLFSAKEEIWRRNQAKMNQKWRV